MRLDSPGGLGELAVPYYGSRNIGQRKLNGEVGCSGRKVLKHTNPHNCKYFPRVRSQGGEEPDEGKMVNVRTNDGGHRGVIEYRGGTVACRRKCGQSCQVEQIRRGARAARLRCEGVGMQKENRGVKPVIRSPSCRSLGGERERPSSTLSPRSAGEKPKKSPLRIEKVLKSGNGSAASCPGQGGGTLGVWGLSVVGWRGGAENLGERTHTPNRDFHLTQGRPEHHRGGHPRTYGEFGSGVENGRKDGVRSSIRSGSKSGGSNAVGWSPIKRAIARRA